MQSTRHGSSRRTRDSAVVARQSHEMNLWPTLARIRSSTSYEMDDGGYAMLMRVHARVGNLVGLSLALVVDGCFPY